VRCVSATQTREREEGCVWFAGGSAVPAEGLCNAEGDLRESTSERNGTRNRPNPSAKATTGLMKETRSHPASAKRKRAEEGRARKDASRWTGTSRKSFAGLDVECAEKEAWGCAPQIRLYYNLIDIRCEVYAISSVLPCLPLRRLASSLPELAFM
jgi:hypothetical protein